MSIQNTLLKTACILFAGSSLASCQAEVVSVGQSDVAEKEQPTSVTIMTFNVENLFDNSDDPGKNDRTYFALAEKQTDEHKAECAKVEVKRWRDQCLYWDWNDEVVEQKLAAVAAAILSAGGGRGPDILALQEIENISILERLRTEYLGTANYLPAILIEGSDIRGIDVAFLSRLPLAADAQLRAFPKNKFDEKRQADTRGILEATFELPDGQLLTSFAVHFPAPYHPTEMRIAAYDHLNALKSTLPADRPAFAAGDFNTTSNEDGKKDMLQRFARPLWEIVNDQGCSGCLGSSYYARDDSWSYLDMILWSPAAFRGENATWEIRAGSFAIANKGPGQTSKKGTPARFDAANGSGVSDHWPVIFAIELK